MNSNPKESSSRADRLLQLIPPDHRLPVVMFLILEGVVLALVLGADTVVKVAAVAGITLVFCVFLFLFFRRRPTVRHEAAATGENTWPATIRRAQALLARDGGTGSEAKDLVKMVLDAFRAQAGQFKVLEFEFRSGLQQKQLTSLHAPLVNVLLNGDFKVRRDSPELIRNAYPASLLFAVTENCVTKKYARELIDSGKLFLHKGIRPSKDNYFEPWDIFLFILGDSIDASVEGIPHQPYVNLFVLDRHGGHANTSPHRWMDEVLERITLDLKARGTV